jgi:hypothetical protein
MRLTSGVDAPSATTTTTATLTKDAPHYTSPVFSKDGKSIFALKDGGLANILIADGASTVTSNLSLGGETPERLVGVGTDGRPAVITKTGRVYALDATTGKSELLADRLDDADKKKLFKASRSCAGKIVFDGAQLLENGSATRTDVFVGDGKTSVNHTKSSHHLYNGDPSFSSDCSAIVLIAAD